MTRESPTPWLDEWGICVEVILTRFRVQNGRNARSPRASQHLPDSSRGLDGQGLRKRGSPHMNYEMNPQMNTQN